MIDDAAGGRCATVSTPARNCVAGDQDGIASPAVTKQGVEALRGFGTVVEYQEYKPLVTLAAPLAFSPLGLVLLRMRKGTRVPTNALYLLPVLVLTAVHVFFSMVSV
jgi:hypothetical protein